jgi:hypothetical protein
MSVERVVVSHTILHFPIVTRICHFQMGQGASSQLAFRKRLGVLPEFWQALDCIWPNTFAGFSTRSREGDYFLFSFTKS